MVKERRRRRSSSSDDSDSEGRQPKYRSRSPQRPKQRHKAERPERMPKIKQEPISDSDEDERHTKRKIKEEYGSHRRGESSREDHRHRQRQQRPVHVKQERHDSDYERHGQREERRRNDTRRQETHRQRQTNLSNLSEHERYGRQQDNDTNETNTEAEPKDAPNFELSGKLTEDTNTYKGIVIKYNEPPEARKPKKRWRLYPFKNDEPMKPFHMHRQSAFLLGRERLVADIPIDHPSCSKQHAVFQYRMVPYEKEDGRRAFRIAPYIIDLNSANGTFVNNKQIEGQRYYELFEKDVIKFGFSSREYVLLHDKSNTADIEDDSD